MGKKIRAAWYITAIKKLPALCNCACGMLIETKKGVLKGIKVGSNQRFVSSIGKIEKAMWVFNCLGRSGWFGQSEVILQTDINFPMKDPWQFSN